MRARIAHCFLLFEWHFSIVLKPQWSELHTVGFVETKALVPPCHQESYSGNGNLVELKCV